MIKCVFQRKRNNIFQSQVVCWTGKNASSLNGLSYALPPQSAAVFTFVVIAFL